MRQDFKLWFYGPLLFIFILTLCFWFLPASEASELNLFDSDVWTVVESEDVENSDGVGPPGAVPPPFICHKAEDMIECGDVNANGCVTATDALIVLRTSIGLDDSCVAECYKE